MIHFLAQTTQPDLTTWSPAAIVYLIGVLVPAILAILAYVKSDSAKQTATDSKEISVAANSNALAAQTTAVAANAKSDINSQRITNVSAHAAAIDGKLTDVARSMPPVPTPESIGKAFDQTTT
jgi:uncharacterized protein (UPF0333 family)